MSSKLHKTRVYRLRPEGENLQQLAIHHEAGALRDVVVETHRGPIGFVGLPVQAMQTGSLCLLLDCLNQSVTYSLAARSFRRKQVLQVASGLDGDRAAMEKVVNQAN